MFVKVSSRGREPERWSMVDVSGAPFPASLDRFVSKPQAVWKAPQSFCLARQAVFAYSESTPDRPAPWPSLFSITVPLSCDLDPPARAAMPQPSRNRRPSIHEVAERALHDQASPAPDDRRSLPTMYWPQQEPGHETRLPPKICVQER